MARPKIFNLEFKCDKCKFRLEVKGSEKEIISARNSLIQIHKDYSPDCPSSKREDFIIKNVEDEDKYFINAGKLIEKRLAETEEVFKLKNYKFEDIVGNDDIKNIIKKRLVNYVKYKEKMSELKKYPGSGLILAGIQGTGKTEIILAAVNDTIISKPENREKFDVIIMKSHDFMSGTVGESGKKIESILDVIRKSNKENKRETILIIDEIDNLAPDRETRSVLTSERTGSLLDEFGGIHDDHTIFLMGTTNKPDRIDSEALVSGRFGNPVLVNILADKEQYEIFSLFTKSLNLSKDIDVKFVNQHMGKFSGRDIRSFTNDLQIRFYEKEDNGEHHSEPEIDIDDIKDLLDTSNYRNTNTFNTERLNKLNSYYSKYNEDVVGADDFAASKGIILAFIENFLEIHSGSIVFKDELLQKIKELNPTTKITKTMITKCMSELEDIELCRSTDDEGKQRPAYRNIKFKR